ncbi:hypothetical protein HBH92_173620 [Parastagonospora nodorum]|nr:hypothetical protein HBI09_149180 [Parastagonospora nodorum]KAH4406028.1 hypothetical protein HBH92_173620 [Parastagonospora nodorum]KAH4460535.1 hypothetical protein HBH91_070490 [Parastagonospora nodorum]KAH4496976.1 hypothetical protein HBH89_138660 [Parastagonospora nodorum]KAH4535153.1 hypothetical protein HBH85_162010 [Parastagonospora nodorum]
MAMKRKESSSGPLKKTDRVTRSQTLHERITPRNQLESPLLQLPPEMRNMIYTYVFKDLVWGMFEWRRQSSSSLNRLALLKTCRQISVEAALLPFAHGIFDIGWERPSKGHMIGLLGELSAKQLGAIRHISALYGSKVGKRMKSTFQVLAVVPRLRCIQLRHPRTITTILLGDNLIKIYLQAAKMGVKDVVQYTKEIKESWIKSQLKDYRPGAKFIFEVKRISTSGPMLASHGSFRNNARVPRRTVATFIRKAR